MPVAAITGASKGLGAALSLALARRGYRLVLGSRNATEIAEFGQAISKLTPTLALRLDVRRKDECVGFIEAGVERFGRLDLLINNAGIWRLGTIEQVTEDDVRDLFETNVFGPIWCSQAAVAVMRRQASGHILNIGSTAAVDLKPSHIAYGASKAALVGFTGCLRSELAGTGVRASVFSPGGMKTGLFRAYPDRVKEDYMDPTVVAQRILDHIDHPTEEWHITLRRR